MRTPTVFLRVGAAFGNQAAQRKLEGREALKPLTLKEIRNNKKGAWAPAPPMFTAFHLPRAKLGAASLPRACAPTIVANVTRAPASIVKTSDTSWLHHGWGARPPKEGPSSAGAALDRQAASLIQSEKDLTRFFGENEPQVAMSAERAGLAPLINRTLMDSRENTPITFLPSRNGSAPAIPPVDYDSDTPTVDYDSDIESDIGSDDGSIASLSDSDSDDEWDYVSPSEMAQAKRLFDKETRDIKRADQAFALLQGRPTAGTTGVVHPDAEPEPIDRDARSLDKGMPASDANKLSLIEEIRAAKDTLKLRKVEAPVAPRIAESSGVPDQRSMLASFNRFDSIHKLSSESDADTSGYLTDRSEPDFSV